MWGGERDFGRDGSQSQQPSDFLVFSNIWANISPTLMYRWDRGIKRFGETHTIWNFRNGRHTLQLGPQASCLAYFSAVLCLSELPLRLVQALKLSFGSISLLHKLKLFVPYPRWAFGYTQPWSLTRLSIEIGKKHLQLDYCQSGPSEYPLLK